MKIFFGLVGIVCMLFGLGSCALGGAGGVAGAFAGATVGTVLFAIGTVALGVASLLEELQRLRRTLTEGLRYFAKGGEPPAGT